MAETGRIIRMSNKRKMSKQEKNQKGGLKNEGLYAMRKDIYWEVSGGFAAKKDSLKGTWDCHQNRNRRV